MSSRILLAIGKIVKAFGIQGDVVIFPMTDNPARFKKLKRALVGKDDTATQEMSITRTAIDARGVRLKFAHVSDRTSAEELVGSLLFIEESEAVRLPKEIFFVHDVVGLNVIGEDGELIGTVKDVLRYPAHDVYVIESKGREILLPAVKEFVRKIDLKAKTMKVKLIEGMSDETAGDENDARENDAD